MSADNQNPQRDNQGRDLLAVKRAIELQDEQARLGREASRAHHEAVVRDVPLADWTTVEGQQVLRCGGHRHVALPRSGRQSATNFDILDLDARERVVTLRRAEVREWLWRSAQADFEAQHGRPAGVPAAPVPEATEAAVAAVAAVAVTQATAAADQEDYLQVLFGANTHAQAVQADPFQALWDSAQADGQRQQQEMQRVREAIRTQLERASAEHASWAVRTYKSNRAQVEFRGDGPSRQASMSIGSINESRRQHALQALTQEIVALEKLQDAMGTPQGQERVMENLRLLMARARDAMDSGNWTGYTLQSMFESMLLEDLKVRGPAAKGRVESNGLSQALWAAVGPTHEHEHDRATLDQQEASADAQQMRERMVARPRG